MGKKKRNKQKNNDSESRFNQLASSVAEFEREEKLIKFEKNFKKVSALFEEWKGIAKEEKMVEKTTLLKTIITQNPGKAKEKLLLLITREKQLENLLPSIISVFDKKIEKSNSIPTATQLQEIIDELEGKNEKKAYAAFKLAMERLKLSKECLL